jgi:hypothetical protein
MHNFHAERGQGGFNYLSDTNYSNTKREISITNVIAYPLQLLCNKIPKLVYHLPVTMQNKLQEACSGGYSMHSYREIENVYYSKGSFYSPPPLLALCLRIYSME